MPRKLTNLPPVAKQSGPPPIKCRGCRREYEHDDKHISQPEGSNLRMLLCPSCRVYTELAPVVGPRSDQSMATGSVRKRILLAERNETIRSRVRSWLVTAGYSVIPQTDKPGVDRLINTSTKFDLVIIGDLGPDTFTTAKKVAERNYHLVTFQKQLPGVVFMRNIHSEIDFVVQIKSLLK